MGTLRRRIIVWACACVAPVAAWAEWQVPAGPVALFKAAPAQYVLVLAKPLAAPLPSAQPLPGQTAAYVLQSAAPLGIERTPQGWAIAEGIPAAPTASALLLNHRWALGGHPLKQASVQVGGTTWQVGLTPVRQRQNGVAVVGVARRGGIQASQNKVVPVAMEPAKAEPRVAAAKPAPQEARAEQAILRYIKIEPAAGLAPVAMPDVSETDLFTSLQAMLGSPQLFALKALPVKIYQPGTVGLMPDEVLAKPLVSVAAEPPLPPSPTFDVPAVSPTTPVAEVSAMGEGDVAEAGAEHGAPAGHEAPKEAAAAAPEGHAEAASAEQAGGHGEAAQSAEAHGGEGEGEMAASTSPTVIDAPEVVAEAPSESGAGEEVGVLIPEHGEHAFMEISEGLQAVADAPAGSPAGREARLALAGVYLSWQRPEEAMAVLATFPHRADGLPAGAVPRLLYGVAQLAAHRPVTAGVFDQKGELAKHAALWAAVTQAAQRNYTLAVENWPREKGILPVYPPYLRAMAQQAQLQALLMTGQQDAVAEGADQMIKSYPADEVPPELYRLKGLALMGTKDEQAGLETLAKAAENTTDEEVATRAKLDFIRALHQRREVSDVQLRQYLETLQQDWRGDETEREMLSLLADLYEKNREPQKALQTWQTIAQAYPRTPELPLITARMAQAFVNVYDPEAEQTFDTLTYLGLYFDFRELLPNTEEGDRVQEWIAERLISANLFDRAIPILEQQLKYRPLDAVAQGRLTLLLAEAYRKNRKPEDAVKLLDAQKALANTQTLRRGWALSEARALADLQRPQAGLAFLQPLLNNPEVQDKEAEQLAAELAWRGQDWPTAAPALEKLLTAVPASVLVSDTAAQLNLFRLAYALGQQGRAEDLAKLKSRYQTAWAQVPRLADDVNAVAVTAGVEGVPPEGGPMQALTTALADINALDKTIAKTRRQMQDNKAQREEYNRRMEYMELLPPPAL